jgi:hypothetical protein
MAKFVFTAKENKPKNVVRWVSFAQKHLRNALAVGAPASTPCGSSYPLSASCVAKRGGDGGREGRGKGGEGIGRGLEASLEIGWETIRPFRKLYGTKTRY